MGSHGKDAWGIFRVHQFEKVSIDPRALDFHVLTPCRLSSSFLPVRSSLLAVACAVTGIPISFVNKNDSVLGKRALLDG
jgi:hypothetical protein